MLFDTQSYGECADADALTEIRDTIPDHHTLQVDGLLPGSHEALVTVMNSRGEDREVTALTRKHQQRYVRQIAETDSVRLASHVKSTAFVLLERFEELRMLCQSCILASRGIRGGQASPERVMRGGNQDGWGKGEDGHSRGKRRAMTVLTIETNA